MLCMVVVCQDHRPSHPYDSETEHVGFSPIRGRHGLLAPSANRRVLKGGREGGRKGGREGGREGGRGQLCEEKKTYR